MSSRYDVSTVIVERRLRTRTRKTTFSRKLEKRRSTHRSSCFNHILILWCLLGQRQGLPSKSDEENEEDGGDRLNDLNAIPGARPMKGDTTDTQSGDEGDTDDFIVDDEDGHQRIDLPTKFSSARVQPLASSFRVVFQLFVHVSCLEPHLREEGMKRLVGLFSSTVPMRAKDDKVIYRDYGAC